MTNHFYAVFSSYSPNSAATNRALSYLDAWEKMGVKVTALFLLPDRKYSQLQLATENIKVMYLWRMMPLKSYLMHHLLYLLYVIRLLCILKKGDSIFVYGQPYLLKWLLWKKDIHIYHERNEHPLAIRLGKWPYVISFDSYIKCCRRINGLFVISSGLKSFFIENGVEKTKVQIVNMTVNPSRFNGISKKNNINPYIAYCGNASNNKDGVDQLIHAFAFVSRKYPNLRLLVIGKAPDKNETNNNSLLAKNLGVGEKVVFTGTVPAAEMPQMLTDATILALDRPDSLQAKHGFPTKLGEYLLTGNPVVVTAVGDIPMFIENGISGMVAEPSNSEDFASKIAWLLEHPEEARTIGENGKKVAMACFNNEIEARKIVNTIIK